MSDWFNEPWNEKCHPLYAQYISFTGVLCSIVGANVDSIEKAKELFDNGLVSIKGKIIKDGSLFLAEGIYTFEIDGVSYIIEVAYTPMSDLEWRIIFDYKDELINGNEITYKKQKHDIRMRLSKPINSKSKLIMCHEYGFCGGFGVKYVPGKENYFTGCAVPIT